MDYEYTVFSENNYGVMHQELNSYGRYGWKLVNVVCDNVCLVDVMMRERQMISSLIDTFGHSNRF